MREAHLRPAQILMIVGNSITHDTRVLKSALALSDGGAEVTILGYTETALRQDSMLGPVRIIRVPVTWARRDADLRSRANRRSGFERLAVTKQERRRLDRKLRRLKREAGSSPSPRHNARLARAQLAGMSLRLRARVGRWVNPVVSRAWKSWDSAVQQRVVGAAWQRILPEISDYADAFGPVIDGLEWDVIHAHDVHMVGVASDAVARRQHQGRPATWVYDAHEFVAGLSLYGGRTARKRAAYLDLEQEYITDAAGVITVTEPLAEELQQRYRLSSRPVVVMNSPVLGAANQSLEVGIREACGLDESVPLLVYSGGVTAARGVATAVEALPLLPGVHLAVVCVPSTATKAVRELADLAARLGVQDRLHLHDPVPPDSVSAFLQSADVGLLPLLHFGSHEVALANKLFEYLYGGVPVVVSDCRAQAEFVRRHEVGAVHAAGDAQSFAEAVQGVLRGADDLRARIATSPDLLEPFAWEHQERSLRAFYREVLGVSSLVEPSSPTALEGLSERVPARTDRPSVLGIGPANMAGQAWAWAKALERELPGLRTEVIAVDRGSPLLFAADEIVTAQTFAKDRTWSARLERHALEDWTHVLLEAGRPLLGVRHGRDFTGDAGVFRTVGIGVGLLLHGSEIRDPRRHAAASRWSPFSDPDDPLTARLQAAVDSLAPRVREFDGPKFVSTPDLLGDVPEAHWLPVTVDPEEWRSERPVLTDRLPVIVHAPSRRTLKGTADVEKAVAPLVEEKLLEFRLVEGVPPEQMPRVVGEADIILDQFSLGSYGVLAVQAMAAGRLVVGHVHEWVRDQCPGALPILEADPSTLTEVLRRTVTTDRAEAATVAAAGPAYVGHVHDGRRAVEVLTKALGLRGH